MRTRLIKGLYYKITNERDDLSTTRELRDETQTPAVGRARKAPERPSSEYG